MNVKKVLFSLLITLPFCVFSQETEYVEAKAKIEKIERRRTRRYVKEIATVTFNTAEGNQMRTTVELNRLPIIGSMKSVSDEITIKYDKNNPAIAQTILGNLITKYGMYILIVLGIIFSINSYLKAVKKSSYKTSNN